MTPRLRAPELVGRGGWINTGGKALSLADFRGRFLLIDHWTLCCANCLHVLDELRPLEAKYHDVLTVVGAHAPKFKHEADHDALVAACERYEVTHPVLDDPDLTTWQAYAVKAWPTLSLVDPEGYLVAQFSGEGHSHALDRLLEELIAEHDAKGTLHRGDGLYVPPVVEETTLRFPAKAIALPDGSLLVADAGHHSIAHLEADGETLIRRFGTGERGLTDGIDAQFSEPNGLCLLPAEIAEEVGYHVVVADTVNHAIRGIDLNSGAVRTLAGTGRQWMQGDGVGALSSPWDLAWFDEKVIIAMAGIHQLWSFDPRTGAVAVWAGTTNEGLKDGPRLEAWFAQSSGLAVAGDTLWIADSETSSLRSITNDTVTSHIGHGLFDFGHVDGPADQALMQHPLGVSVLPDGSIAICDTYNGAIRRYEPSTRTVSTVITGLGEPSGALVLEDGLLLVVESTRHHLTHVRLPEEALIIDGDALRTQRPPTAIAGGEVTLEIVFTPPPGQKMDERYGPSTRLLVSSTPPALLKSGEGRDTALTRTIVLDPAVGEGVLHIAAMAASCDVEGEFPACHVHQQDWGVPVIISPDAPASLRLPLGGI
jgi:hypothetical protein